MYPAPLELLVLSNRPLALLEHRAEVPSNFSRCSAASVPPVIGMLVLRTNETGLPAFRMTTISSTVSGSASPVGVPSPFAKIASAMSACSTNCLFSASCGRKPNWL